MGGIELLTFQSVFAFPEKRENALFQFRYAFRSENRSAIFLMVF